MSNDAFNSLESLTISNEPQEKKNTVKPVSSNDMETFLQYLESNKADEDLDEYKKEITPNRPNGNIAELIPDLPENQTKRKAKKPQISTDEIQGEPSFEELMNRGKLCFNEEIGTLEYE